MPFPLPKLPQLDYHKPPGGRGHQRWFGAHRQGRTHAGCDLVVPHKTEIYAIDEGEVMYLSRNFYHGTGALALRHRTGYVSRYCEVEPDSLRGVKLGTYFYAGDVIARVGKMYSSAMLHFELYAGVCDGSLSQANAKNPYKRRADLMDPTELLDSLRPYVGVAHQPVAVDTSKLAIR